MKVLQAVTIVAAVATLCLLQALQTEARDIVRKDTKCSCDPQGPAYQLLRGDNQVHNCEVGFYCDCANGKRLQCFAPPFFKWKYDEVHQVCDLNFDCAAFFKRITTTTEPPTTTQQPTTEPTTTEQPTTEPTTTEPTTTEPTTTEPTTTEPPTTEPPTTEPTTTEPSTTTTEASTTIEPTTEPATATVEPTTDLTTKIPSPTPSVGCTCDPNGPDYQLIRGDDELEKCDDGYYCDCSYGEVDRCLDVVGIGWRFNEKSQRCEFEYDCQSYLRPTTTAEPSTTTTTTTEPSTTEPSTTTTEASTTTEPSTTEPPTTEPPTTTTEASTTTEPSTTEPPTTEPSTTTTEASTTAEPTTTEPSTTEPSTTEPSTTEFPTPEPSTISPGPLAECTCERGWGHLYQLVRGEDQASSCTHGYYCDCSSGKRLRCLNVLTLGWRFDEDAQKCRLFHGCGAL